MLENRNAMIDSVRETGGHTLVSDPQIRSYLERNPVREEMGKFGVPQDKYRWGFYGHGTMEYDSWGKPKKD